MDDMLERVNADAFFGRVDIDNAGSSKQLCMSVSWSLACPSPS